MKKNKSIVLATICMMFFSGYNTFSEIPKGTVIIKEKAFDLNYIFLNKKGEEDLKELQTAIKYNNQHIIIKDFQGNFILNSTGEKVDSHKIPRVLYKGDFTTEYLEGDGEEITFNIESTNVIDSSSIEMIFNRDIENNLDKSNIKINGKELNREDKVVCIENKLCIILGTPLKNGEKIHVEVENVCDVYGNKIQKTIKKECVLLEESFKSKESQDDSKERTKIDDEVSEIHGDNSKQDKEIKQEEEIDISISSQNIEGTTKCDATIDIYVKSSESKDNQISVIIMSEDGQVLYLDQLEVINGLAKLKCRIDKKNASIIVNTMRANSKSIFKHNFS